MAQNDTKKKDLIQLAAFLALIVLAGWLSANWFFRIDLTAEKRYTLAPITRDFLRNMESDVMVKVYLDGELNVGFQKLARATREALDEFRIISRGKFHYEFVDPMEDSEARQELEKMELKPVPVFESSADGRKIQSNVYPYALFNVDGYDLPVNLLENLPGLSGAENLNISMEGLEYKITDVIRRLISDEVPAIAFLEGQGQLDELDVFDISEALSYYYQVDRGSLTEDPYILDNYKALIIAKPSSQFSERDKFIVDQYIMRGGRVLWLVDAVQVTLDSLRTSTQTVGLATDLALNDQLFRYGVRINPELVQDVQAAMIPVNVSTPGEQPQLVPVPWMFNPLLNTNREHPVTRNINIVKGEFVSSIDTVGSPAGIQREVLLRTGRHSRRLPVPVFISLAMVNEQPDRAEFPHSYVPVAVSLSGEFPSVYANRPIPPGVNISPSEVRHQSEPTRMIVVADGDVIRNDVRMRHGGSPQPMPLGFDEVGNQNFGNKDFILNAIHYLADDEAGWPYAPATTSCGCWTVKN
ncbi:gliding motility-associated ABC transporter substrate-binding protein GldG [Geofilum rubicundum]|uniref:Gliding motility protein GldG n=1 Tax=Geofilum rubicundum JCM 15548 TaxID=1236989 RepID=A0A0E9M2R3_9BACT|nr:gliding motility-associated ABC transporter substrate-binding protein GldG [Geofilum rubicundum]GAO31824.1 gliding motility protein GldG [Geofilum rubicundum JCM 15548]